MEQTDHQDSIVIVISKIIPKLKNKFITNDEWIKIDLPDTLEDEKHFFQCKYWHY